MVRVALTGGIATGKSTVLRLLQARHVPTIDADVLAREVVAPGSPGLEAVVERFGRAMLDADGALDRGALAAVVFSDPHARRDLEQIVHPAVYAAIQDWLEELPRGHAPGGRRHPPAVRDGSPGATSIGSSSWPARPTSNCAA